MRITDIISLLQKQKWYILSAVLLLVGVVTILSLGDSSDAMHEDTPLSKKSVFFTEERTMDSEVNITKKKSDAQKHTILMVHTRKLTSQEKEVIGSKPKTNRDKSSVKNSISKSNQDTEKFLIRTAREVGFPETEIWKLLRHAYAESTWRFDAVNRFQGESYVGVLQVCSCHFKQYGHLVGATSEIEFFRLMKDPIKNLTVSRALWEADIRNPGFKRFGKWIRDGWGPWLDTYRFRESEKYKRTPWRQIITVYKYGVSVG